MPDLEKVKAAGRVRVCEADPRWSLRFNLSLTFARDRPVLTRTVERSRRRFSWQQLSRPQNGRHENTRVSSDAAVTLRNRTRLQVSIFARDVLAPSVAPHQRTSHVHRNYLSELI